MAVFRPDRFEKLRYLIERKPEALGYPNNGNPAQDVSRKSALIAGASGRLDKPFLLIEM